MNLTPEEYLALVAKQKRHKYNVAPKEQRTDATGKVYHSKRERDRIDELKLLEQAGAIRDLRTQVEFKLVVNGVHVCAYRADAVFVDVATGKQVVEDVKPRIRKGKWKGRTADYRIKRKLMLALHGIEIVEV